MALAKHGFVVLLVAVLVNFSTSWMCGHSVYMAQADHDDAEQCHPHSHGPFEHDHHSDHDSDHEENRVGVSLLATSVSQGTLLAPAQFTKLHQSPLISITSDEEATERKALARSSPTPRVYGKALLFRIKRLLA